MDTPPPPSRLLQLPTRTKSPKRPRNAKNLSLNVPSLAQLNSVVAMASPKTAVAPAFSFNVSSSSNRADLDYPSHLYSSPNALPAFPHSTALSNNNNNNNNKNNNRAGCTLDPSTDNTPLLSSKPKHTIPSKPIDLACPTLYTPKSENETSTHTSPSNFHVSTLPTNNSGHKLGFVSSYSSSSTSSSSSSSSSSYSSSISSSSSPSSANSPPTTSPSLSSVSPSSLQKPLPQPLFISIPQSPTVSTSSSSSSLHSKVSGDYPTLSNDSTFMDETSSKLQSQIDNKPPPSYLLSHYQSYKHNTMTSSSAPFPSQAEDKYVIVNTIPLGDPSDMEPSFTSYPSGPVAICHPNIYLYSEPTREEASQFDVVINVAKEVKNPFVDASSNTAGGNNTRFGTTSIITSAIGSNKSITNADATRNTQNANTIPSYAAESATTFAQHDSAGSSDAKFSSGTGGLQVNVSPAGAFYSGTSDLQQQQQHQPAAPLSVFSSSEYAKPSFDNISLSSSSSSYSTFLSIPSSPPSLESNSDTVMSSPTSSSSIISSPPSLVANTWPQKSLGVVDNSTAVFLQSETESLSRSLSRLPSNTCPDNNITFSPLSDKNQHPAMASDSTINNNIGHGDSSLSSTTTSTAGSPTNTSHQRHGEVSKDSSRPAYSYVNNASLPVTFLNGSHMDFKRSNSTGNRNTSATKKTGRANTISINTTRKYIGEQQHASYSEPCINTKGKEQVSLQQRQYDDTTRTSNHNRRNNMEFSIDTPNDKNNDKRLDSLGKTNSAQSAFPTLETKPTVIATSVSTPEYIYVPWDHNSALTPDLELLTSILFDRANEGKRILVHCQCGVSRSASLLVAYVMRLNGWGVHQAYAWVKDKSPGISPNMSLIYQLVEWASIVENIEKQNGSRFPQK